METTLKEVLMPFNAKEVEHFNEATRNCSTEQKLAVAKLMREEKLPDGWQFTESQIRRFILHDSLSKINWFPGIEINNGTSPIEHFADKQLEGFKERQFKAYRASGMSEAEARSAAGL